MRRKPGNIYKKHLKTLFAFFVGFGVDERSEPGSLYAYTDKTTRCVIRSLSGRGLWLGGQSNHSINQSANQSITQSIHQLNKQSVEIIC